MVNYSRKLGVLIEQGLAEDFRTERKFEAIALFHVLEHLSEPKSIIGKVSGWLKKDGYLFLELPNIESFLARKMGSDWEMINSEHLWYFSPKTIKIFLEGNGFKTKRIYFRQFDEWNLGLGECLIRLGLKRPAIKKNSLLPAKNILKKNSAKENFLALARKVLCFLVKFLKRGDYILIVAKKNV